MPESETDPSFDPTQPTQLRPGTHPSAPSGSHYAVELPYAEELQALLEGRYLVESFLGQGGMGAVYRGSQLPLKRPVAIKILQKRQAAGEEDEFAFEERFKREAYAMASMTHPNIVQVYDCGDAGENFLFISMELVEGGDLSDALKAGKVTPEVALKLIPQICDGLQAAHERGLVHRDIKPANIFLTADGRPKVADFGLAKKFDVKSTFVTKTGLGMGTPDYAAPEQYEGVADIDHRADIYAFGVMMYQMLTGRLPRGVYKMPSQMVPGLDPRIDDVVGRAMANERADRWQSAAEIKAALASLATQPARTTPAPARTSAVPAAVKPATASPARPAARTSATAMPGRAAVPQAAAPAAPKKSGAGMIAGVLGAIVVLAGGAFFLLKKPKPGESGSSSGTMAEKEPSVAPSPSAAPVPPPPPPSRPSKPGERWVDALAEWQATPYGKSSDQLAKTTEGIALTKRGDIRAGKGLKNVAVRATVRKIDWYAEIRAFSSESKSPEPGRNFSLNLMVRSDGELRLDTGLFDVAGSKETLYRQRMPAGFDREGRYELELRIENGKVTAYLNGQEKASAPADGKGLGSVELGGGEGMIIERYEYVDLGADAATLAAPAVTPGNAPVAPPVATSGAEIDLLATANVERDVIAGNWTTAPEGLKLDQGTYGALDFPAAVPAEYDYEIEFTPLTGGNNVNQYISAQGHSFAWKLNAHAKSPPLYGFELLDGKFSKDTTEARTVINTALQVGTRYRSTVEVRKDSLRALLDGKELVKWTGDFSRFSMEAGTKLRDPNHVGVGSYKRGVVFHKAVLRPVAANSSPAAPQAPMPVASIPAGPATTLPPAPTTPRQTIDLIASIDLTKDRVRSVGFTNANEWIKTGNVLTYNSDGKSGKVTAPVSLDGLRDYEIGLILRRLSGSGSFTIDLPVSASRQTGIVIDPSIIQIGPVNGRLQKIGDWPKSVTGDARILARVRFAPDGRHGSVTVTINNQVVAQREGALADMGKPLEFHPEFPGQQTTSIFFHQDSFAVAVWQLRVYEGEAKVLRGGTPAGTSQAMSSAPAPTAGKAGTPLFDGSTLKGWRVQGAGDAFVVEDGCIKATGARCTLMFAGLPGTSPIMKDLDLTMKVKTENQANSGVFVHCRQNNDGVSFGNALELQIANENRDPQKTGGVYGIKPVNKIVVHDGEWFDYRITVRGMTVTTYINGEKVVEWTQPSGWTPPKGGAELSEGTIGLQSNGGVVWFKDISLQSP